jgi:hypothetical protein
VFIAHDSPLFVVISNTCCTFCVVRNTLANHYAIWSQSHNRQTIHLDLPLSMAWRRQPLPLPNPPHKIPSPQLLHYLQISLTLSPSNPNCILWQAQCVNVKNFSLMAMRVATKTTWRAVVITKPLSSSPMMCLYSAVTSEGRPTCTCLFK